MSSDGVDAVPVYQPSSRISRTLHALFIASPDSMTKVGAYYASTFAGGGWVIVSKGATRHRVGFTVKKGSQRATVVVFANGGGSLVSIATPR